MPFEGPQAPAGGHSIGSGQPESLLKLPLLWRLLRGLLEQNGGSAATPELQVTSTVGNQKVLEHI
jgi:hypothetical protein